MTLFDRPFMLFDEVDVDPVLLAHDTLGSVGYVLDACGVRIGFATDLGRVPRLLLDRFVNLDVVLFESNYDRTMQIRSDRPAYLKRRIMGGAGHLSNEQSFEAVRRIAARSKLSHIVLLHLSRQCNDPAIISHHYAQHARLRLILFFSRRSWLSIFFE